MGLDGLMISGVDERPSRTLGPPVKPPTAPMFDCETGLPQLVIQVLYVARKVIH